MVRVGTLYMVKGVLNTEGGWYAYRHHIGGTLFCGGDHFWGVGGDGISLADEVSEVNMAGADYLVNGIIDVCGGLNPAGAWVYTFLAYFEAVMGEVFQVDSFAGILMGAIAAVGDFSLGDYAVTAVVIFARVGDFQ